VSTPPPVRANSDSLYVAGAQRAALVEQAPLNDRCVPYELAIFPDECVYPAERMLPVVVGEVPIERVVEEPSNGVERGRVEICGVSDSRPGVAGPTPSSRRCR
jgi:hypothetical protein